MSELMETVHWECYSKAEIGEACNYLANHSSFRIVNLILWYNPYVWKQNSLLMNCRYSSFI